MLKSIANVCASAAAKLNTKESFNQEDMSLTQNIVQLVVYIVALIILMLVGKFLWNDVLTNLFTGVKPMKHAWEVIGLYVLLRLLFPSS